MCVFFILGKWTYRINECCYTGKYSSEKNVHFLSATACSSIRNWWSKRIANCMKQWMNDNMWEWWKEWVEIAEIKTLNTENCLNFFQKYINNIQMGYRFMNIHHNSAIFSSQYVVLDVLPFVVFIYISFYRSLSLAPVI